MPAPDARQFVASKPNDPGGRGSLVAHPHGGVVLVFDIFQG